MEQLKVKHILQAVVSLQADGKLTDEEIMEMPVYLGDDDELNGVHCAWGCDVVSNNDPESAWLIELINDCAGNKPFKKAAFLIS